MYTFIINPVAGGGMATRLEPQLRAHMEKAGCEYRFVTTEAPDHAAVLAREAAAMPGCQGVIAVGGDGTAYSTAIGLMDTGVPLGIIPAGTGNDFIKTSGTPKDPIQALDFILTHPARAVDIGTLNERMFLNVGGTGFDVQVLDRTERFKKHFRGLVPYMLGLITAITAYKPVHVHCTIDDEQVIDRDLLICSVANGRIFGGGIPICPEAEIDDGLLDVVLVAHRPRWQIPFYLPLLMMGRITRCKITTHIRCRKVDIISKGMRLNADGEVAPADEGHFAVNSGKLLLFW